MLPEQRSGVLVGDRSWIELAEVRQAAPGPFAACTESVEVERSQHVTDRAAGEEDAETEAREAVAELDVLQGDHPLVEASALDEELALRGNTPGPEVTEVEQLAVSELRVGGEELTHLCHEVHELGNAKRGVPRAVTQCDYFDRRVLLVHAEVLLDEIRVGNVVVVGEED